MKNSYKFFANKECFYFPCHKVENEDEFNCLFCYCPLYLKEKCIGNPKTTITGIKDCSNCLVPHTPSKYDAILNNLFDPEQLEFKEPE